MSVIKLLFFNAPPYPKPIKINSNKILYNDANSDFKLILTVESELEEDNKRVELYVHKLILKTLDFFKEYFDGKDKYGKDSDFEMELTLSSINQLNAYMSILNIVYGFPIENKQEKDFCLEYLLACDFLMTNNMPTIQWVLPYFTLNTNANFINEYGDIESKILASYMNLPPDERTAIFQRKKKDRIKAAQSNTFTLTIIINTDPWSEEKTERTAIDIEFLGSLSNKYEIDVTKAFISLGFVVNAKLEIELKEVTDSDYIKPGFYFASFGFPNSRKYILTYVLKLNQGIGKSNKFKLEIKKKKPIVNNYVGIREKLQEYCNFLIQERADDDNPLFKTEEVMDNNGKSSRVYKLRSPSHSK